MRNTALSLSVLVSCQFFNAESPEETEAGTETATETGSVVGTTLGGESSTFGESSTSTETTSTSQTTGTESESSESSTTDITTETSAEECFDIKSDPIGDGVEVGDAPWHPCHLPKPCPTIEHTYLTPWTGNCYNIPEEIYDPDSGMCALQALKSGNMATIEIGGCPGGQFATATQLLLRGDGTLMWRRDEWFDLIHEVHLTWLSLPDDAYFDACDIATAKGFEECILGIRDQECQVGEPQCPVDF